MSISKKKDLITVTLLARITDFQLHSNDKELFNFGEELREVIVNFSEGAEIEKFSDTCRKCGCTEFLCGHNKRGY